MNKNNKNYYKSIKKALDCNILMKHCILNEIKNDIILYEESTNDDISSIEKTFGTPQEIANKANIDFSYYKTRRIVLRIMILILIIIIVLLSVYFIINIIDIFKYRTGTYTVRIR